MAYRRRKHRYFYKLTFWVLIETLLSRETYIQSIIVNEVGSRVRLPGF